MTRPFDITADPLPNGTLVEASAGTGKTHAVAAYVTKALATNDTLRIGEILVTTYTRNAAAELRERIRTRLIVTAGILRGDAPPAGYRKDELDEHLSAATAERAAMARRLERAAAEFDTAMIGTIHAICARVLRLAGVEATEAGDDELRDRVLDEVVNDAVVVEAVAGRVLDEKALRRLVKTRIADPFVQLTYDATECPGAPPDLLDHVRDLIKACAERARSRMQNSPSFDELLVRAWKEVTEQPSDTTADKIRKAAFVEMLQEKFKLAIVDEAQDTNRLQWEFFHAIFPPTGRNVLVAVGDPKQAIYRFRGADVTAYVAHAQDGVPPEPAVDPTQSPALPRRTLSVNRRSDKPLLDGLNAVMAGAEFGANIHYQEVTAARGRENTQIVGLRPVEFLDVESTSLVEAASRKVHELLTGSHFRPTEKRPFRPREVCVLVRTNAVGSAIARRLSRLKIPAVTEGTASVMDGQMAADILSLLEAMERPSHLGRARRAAATVFFGEAIEDVARLDEARLHQIQSAIAGLHAILQREGIAAMAAAVIGDRNRMTRIATGDGGDRRIVDFNHVVELLNDTTGGGGCHARQMIEHFAALAAQDKKAELVSRRVESDAEAVTVMTVHAAKGLQFPCVVVVDAWKKLDSAGQPEVFHRDGVRHMDIGKAIPNGDIGEDAKHASRDADNEELRRLIYVAVTRPEHHVCILRTSKWAESLLAAVLRNAPGAASHSPSEFADSIAVRSVTDLPAAKEWKSSKSSTGIAVAAVPAEVKQTYRRTSYSGIAKAAARVESTSHEPEGHGHDEDVPAAAAAPLAPEDGDSELTAVDPGMDGVRTEPIANEPDVSGFTIAPLPAGTAFGSIAHDIFENLEVGPGMAEADLRGEVRRVVGELATARFVRDHVDDFATLISDALLTPFGGPAGAIFRDLRFVDFAPQDRLAELDFEMAVAGLDRGIKARHVGQVLKGFLERSPGFDRDPLHEYAERLAGPAFDVPLAGLVNGSIDAVFRLPGRPADDPRILIADYKTNKLHARDATSPLAAYAPAKLVDAMASHHYLLQALVYGTAVWRLLRWRLGPCKPANWDPGECVAGVVYGFVRGMKGPTTPEDTSGGRYGVFTWLPPAGLWRRLSDLFAGDLTGLEP